MIFDLLVIDTKISKSTRISQIRIYINRFIVNKYHLL